MTYTYYTGTEPSPRGYGKISREYQLYEQVLGKDGNVWEVRENVRGIKYWSRSSQRRKGDEKKHTQNCERIRHQYNSLLRRYKNEKKRGLKASTQQQPFRHFSQNKILSQVKKENQELYTEIEQLKLMKDKNVNFLAASTGLKKDVIMQLKQELKSREEIKGLQVELQAARLQFSEELKKIQEEYEAKLQQCESRLSAAQETELEKAPIQEIITQEKTATGTIATTEIFTHETLMLFMAIATFTSSELYDFDSLKDEIDSADIPTKDQTTLDENVEKLQDLQIETPSYLPVGNLKLLTQGGNAETASISKRTIQTAKSTINKIGDLLWKHKGKIFLGVAATVFASGLYNFLNSPAAANMAAYFYRTHRSASFSDMSKATYAYNELIYQYVRKFRPEAFQEGLSATIFT